jgi:hypothetical protein
MGEVLLSPIHNVGINRIHWVIQENIERKRSIGKKNGWEK